MKLYEPLPQEVEYRGTVYSLDLSFPVVLAAFDALEDAALDEKERISTALDLLVNDPHPDSPGLLEAIGRIISGGPAPKEPPVMDLSQDWQFIYAGFLQAYGIDLFERRDLHFLAFSALLKSLPGNTRMAEIAELREKPIPPATKGNAQYRAELAAKKAKYALKRDNGLENGLLSIFNALKAQAERR